MGGLALPVMPLPQPNRDRTMPSYELILISRPDLSPQQVDALVETTTTEVTEAGATVVATEYWGLRNLAYRINKNRKAHYSLLKIDAQAPVIHELERKLRISEEVMRYQTVRVETNDDGPSPILARREREEKKAKARAEATTVEA
jgi:small subunit ribosomal protein S6